MENGPLVSVIIPAFNAQNFIAETLDSIFAQTFQNIEVIVVDDGSTDKTSKIATSYGTRVLCFYQTNSGGCAVPRNTGIRISSGQYLCFIDADDLMTPDRIRSQVAFLERNPEIGIVFSDYQNFNECGPLQETHFATCPNLWSRLRDLDEIVLHDGCACLALENFGIAGSFMIRRELLNLEKGFEASLKACEDFHFYFRLARRTLVGVINKVGLMRRMHGNNMSSNLVKMLSEGMRCRALLRDGESDAEVRVLLNRYILRCKNGLARYHADQGHFLESLKYDCQVLSRPFYGWETRGACRNMVRTFLMAAGIHNGKKRSVQS